MEDRTNRARIQALSLIAQALDVWQVDPDQQEPEEQQAWNELLDAANVLARIISNPGC